MFNKLKSNELLAGSAIVFIGSFAGSFLNYLFQLLMGRVLSPTEYGVLTALFSLLYITSVPGGVLATTATKFASKYKARGDFKAVTACLVWTTKVVSVLGVVIFACFLIFRNQVAGFLKISNPALPVVFSVFIFLSLLGPAPLGFLRGLLRFKAFALASFLGSLAKLVLGVGLVLLGWGLWGALGGLIASGVLTLLISLLLLRKNLEVPFSGSSFSQRELLAYTLPTVFILLALSSFYNADVLIVKHFFSADEAGVYSSVVMLGRVIFFGLSSIALVMFPLASEKYENGEDSSGILVKSLGTTGVGAAVAWTAYSVFPSLLVSVFFGQAYLGAVPYLGQFALFMGLYSLVNLLVQFFLSIRKTKIALSLCVLAAVQVLALWFFHGSLAQVIHVNIAVTVGTLVTLGFYYLWGKKQLSTISDQL